MNISKEDPRLTAYVLGELSAEDTSLVEQAIQESEELAAYVASLGELCGVLEEALVQETLPEQGGEEASSVKVKKTVRFPVWMQCSALLAPVAAACLVFLVVRQDPQLQKTVTSDGVMLEAPEPMAIIPPKKQHTVKMVLNEEAKPLQITDNDLKDEDAIVELAELKASPPPEAIRIDKSKQDLAAIRSEILSKKEAIVSLSESSGRNTAVKSPVVVRKRSAVSPTASTILDDSFAPSSERSIDPSSNSIGFVEGWMSRSDFLPTPLPVPPVVSTAGEEYPHLQESGFANPLVTALSTFSIDVDTSSYANFRRFVQSRQPVVPDAIRIEEWMNYFPYDYAHPVSLQETPFAADIALTEAPWQPGHLLARIGIQGYEMAWQDRPASNLVLLLDVSGSMKSAKKLPLLKDALRMLVHRLDERDRVAIVVYAGASGLVLPSTTANNQETIEQALAQLRAGGSTNGASGIELAYEQAQKHFIEGGNNRVILCTDGDFNVGMTKESLLEDLIAAKAESGVYLSVLGFGMGNYQDERLEILSNRGNGNYAYIDSAKEARKVFMRDLTGTLITIAKDVKLQVEFNPTKVKAYRLIGYENRALAAEDFNNDKKDAGEIGSGHRVTALYEIVPQGAASELAEVDDLRFQKAAVGQSEDWFHLKVRYKRPDEDVSTLWEVSFAEEAQAFAESSVDTRFAAAVAGAALILRGSEFVGDAELKDMEAIAFDAIGKDEGGYRSEFVELLQRVVPAKF